ncbi:MAG: RNA-binding cell elongation regulator Jag/EloR [Mobilitalea sp.]
MEWKEFTAKTVEEALTNAMQELGTTIDNMEYEVIEKETSGFLGMFGKAAKIKARTKMSIHMVTKKFLDDVFHAMSITASSIVNYDEENATIDINIDGDEMGVLIGKRGQTLDSLQYLVSLVANKNSENYIKVKLDTENYRARRKETLENLAKNIAFKVKRTRKPVSLEPMNPYERRIIHSALQNDKFVETYSEGEEPFRKVVINIKKGLVEKKYNNNYSNNHKNSSSNGYRKDYNKDTNKDSSNREFKKDYKKDFNKDNNGVTNKNYKKPFNTSKSAYNSNYSTDYKKDYEKYKESKEKKDLTAESN